MGLTEGRRKEVEQVVQMMSEYYWAAEDAPTPHERRLAVMLQDVLAALAAAERVADENYSDLLAQMDEAWGSAPEIGRVEINAFLESRIVHKPTTKLRERLRKLEAVADAARAIIQLGVGRVVVAGAMDTRLRLALSALDAEPVKEGGR